MMVAFRGENKLAFFISASQTNLRGLNNNKEGGGLIIWDCLKVEWGVLGDKNELAYSCPQGLHIGPDLSGSLAREGFWRSPKR
jgi:hypothetical protein